MGAKRILIVAIALLGFSYISTSVILLSLGLPTSQFNFVAKAFIASLFALTILMSSTDDLRRLGLGWAIIAFFSVYSIRMLYDLFGLDLVPIFQTPTYALSYFFGLTFMPVVAIFLHMRTASTKDLHNLVLALVIIANLLLTLYFVAGGVVTDETQFGGRAQVASEVEGAAIINPIIVSLMGTFLFAMCVGRLLAVRTDPLWRQVALGTLAIYSVSNVIIGGSRGPIVALALCLVAVTFVSVRGALGDLAHVRRGMVVYVVGGLLGFVGFIASAGGSLYIYQRFADMFEARSQGQLEERDFLLADAWRDFANSPLIGESYVSRGGGHPHNFIAEALMATGVSGTVFLLIAMFFVLVGIWRVLHGRAGPYGVSLALLTICYIVAGLVSGAIGQYPELWAFMAVMIVLGWERLPQARSAITPTPDVRIPATVVTS